MPKLGKTRSEDMSKIESVLKVAMILHHARIEAVPLICSEENGGSVSWLVTRVMAGQLDRRTIRKQNVVELHLS